MELMHGGLLIIGGRRSGPTGAQPRGSRSRAPPATKAACVFLIKSAVDPRDLRRAPLPIVRGLIDVGWGRLSSRGRFVGGGHHGTVRRVGGAKCLHAFI